MNDKNMFEVIKAGPVSVLCLVLLTALVLKWCNWLAFSRVLPFWQLAFLAGALLWIRLTFSVTKFIQPLLLCSAILLTLLKWFGVVATPLFH